MELGCSGMALGWHQDALECTEIALKWSWHWDGTGMRCEGAGIHQNGGGAGMQLVRWSRDAI